MTPTAQPHTHKDRTITVHKASGLLSRFGLPDVRGEAWLNFTTFLSRLWFARLWVLQEAALAQCSIILRGSKELAWNDLGKTQCAFLRPFFGSHAVGPQA